MKKYISKKKLREFGLIISLGIPIFFAILSPTLLSHYFNLIIFFITIPSAISSIFFPNLLSSPYKLWMKIGYILGWLNSKIILGLIFFILIIPISLIMKIMGYDPLKVNKSNKKSYREIVQSRKIDLRRIF
jgi:hypothetical protein